MRPGGRDAEPDAFGALRELAADVGHLVLELRDVGANLGADLDDRLVQFALDLIAQRRRARRQELRDVRPQLPGVRVDDLELFLDADGEGVGHPAIIISSEGLRPSDSPTRSLAHRCAGSLRSRGSLARLARVADSKGGDGILRITPA